MDWKVILVCLAIIIVVIVIGEELITQSGETNVALPGDHQEDELEKLRERKKRANKSKGDL